MIKFNNIIKTETFIELDADNGGKMFMPTSQTIFVDDESGAISVKTTGSRKTIGYVISGGTPPVPPEPQFKWKATYQDGHTESAECDDTGEIVSDEINKENLVSLEIGDCVETIGEYALASSNKLASVIIPNNVTSIGDSAFNTCEQITAITIPNSVISIGELAFNWCKSLTSVICLPITPPMLGGRPFRETNNCPIYVPAESVDAYKAAEGWSNYADRIQPIS